MGTTRKVTIVRHAVSHPGLIGRLNYSGKKLCSRISGKGRNQHHSNSLQCTPSRKLSRESNAFRHLQSSADAVDDAFEEAFGILISHLTVAQGKLSFCQLGELGPASRDQNRTAEHLYCARVAPCLSQWVTSAGTA